MALPLLTADAVFSPSSRDTWDCNAVQTTIPLTPPTLKTSTKQSILEKKKPDQNNQSQNMQGASNSQCPWSIEHINEATASLGNEGKYKWFLIPNLPVLQTRNCRCTGMIDHVTSVLLCPACLGTELTFLHLQKIPYKHYTRIKRPPNSLQS